MPDIDQAGHLGGPVSPDVDNALSLVDDAIGSLIAGLAQRNLGSVVDLIVVSDHGMASTANERLIYLDDVLGDGYAEIEHRDGASCVSAGPESKLMARLAMCGLAFQARLRCIDIL